MFESASRFKLGGPTTGLLPAHTARLAILVSCLNVCIFSILLTFCACFSAVLHTRTVIYSTVKRNSMKNLHCTMMISHLHLLVNHRKKSGSVVAVLQKEKISGRGWRSGLKHAEHNGVIHGPAPVGKRKSLRIQLIYCIQCANRPDLGYYLAGTLRRPWPKTNSAFNHWSPTTHLWKMLSPMTAISPGQLVHFKWRVWVLWRTSFKLCPSSLLDSSNIPLLQL